MSGPWNAGRGLQPAEGAALAPFLECYAAEGTLAERMLRRAGTLPGREDLLQLMSDLYGCLVANRPLAVPA